MKVSQKRDYITIFYVNIVQKMEINATQAERESIKFKQKLNT